MPLPELRFRIPFSAASFFVAERRQQYLETVEPHRAELFRFARGLTNSPWDAEDLVQETLMRAFSGACRWIQARSFSVFDAFTHRNSTSPDTR